MRRYISCVQSALTFYIFMVYFIRQRSVHDAALTVLSNVVSLSITTEVNSNGTKTHDPRCSSWQHLSTQCAVFAVFTCRRTLINTLHGAFARR